MGFLPLDLLVAAQRCDSGLQRCFFGTADMERQAECSGRGDARRIAEQGGKPIGAGTGGKPGMESRCNDDFLRRSARHQLAIGDVSDLVTALGLVHVVG